MKLVFVTVSAPAIQYLARLSKEFKEEKNAEMELYLYYAISTLSKTKRKQMIEKIAEANFTFVDLMGSPMMLCQAVEEGLKQTKGEIVPFGEFGREYLKLGEFQASKTMDEGKKLDMEAMKKMAGMRKSMPKVMSHMMPAHVKDKMNYGRIMSYFSNADMDNIRQMLYLILSVYGGQKGLPKPKEPRKAPKAGICLPASMEYFDSYEEFCKKVPMNTEKPLAVLLFYGTMYPRDNSALVQTIMERFSEIVQVLPIAVAGMEAVNDGTLEQLLTQTGGHKVELIINTMSFRLSAGPMGGASEVGTALLENMDVPYLHPYIMTRKSREEWLSSVQGTSASEVMISIMLPEMDGAVDIMPIAAREDKEYIEEYDVYIDEMEPIEDRMELLVKRAKRMLALRKKDNAEKKIAILGYNYPPGEANMFGGAFLDTFQSLSSILKALKEAGYTTEEKTAEELKDFFLGEGLANEPRYREASENMVVYEREKYAEYLKKQDDAAEIENVWGKLPGEIMVSLDGDIQIPGIQIGNIWIGLQPSRGTMDDDKTYHDKTLPPHHQYLAYYRYIKEEFQADALLHIGTHGTLEFLKGKEAGMSGKCFPDRLIEDLPHFYLYYCGNPSEGVIARRRSNAMLISYMPPVFVEGGLYDEYKHLNDLLEEYRQAERLHPASMEALKQEIEQSAEKLNMEKDFSILETQLYEMKHSLIPYGLHVFGTGYTKEEAEDYAARSEEEDKEKLIESASVSMEMSTLLHALSGGYIPAGMGGDIYRTPEVLPSGRNLYQFDQRLVPTNLAVQRGNIIAEKTLARYKQETGTFPESTAVILWGLETSRTQGETLSQIFSYWGVRCVRKSAGGNRSFEIIPLQELGRPRIDVTIQICGFFRDMFPTLIDCLSDLVQELSSLPETDEENYIKAHTKQRYAFLMQQGYDEEEARELSYARIFGPEEGEYGTGITSIIESKNWDTEEEIGNNFISSLRHIYNRNLHGKNIKGLYEENLSCVDMVSQIRDNQEYEITDLDHYYEFFGGLSKSVEMIRGQKARMYITDTTDREIKTNTIGEAIQSGLRKRILNPKWMQGLMEHDYHGGQKVAERFENMMGLAATTGAVENWMYDELHETYVENEKNREKLLHNNKEAYMQLLEQMLEYYNRHYWDAKDEQIEEIQQIYLALEEQLEEGI